MAIWREESIDKIAARQLSGEDLLSETEAVWIFNPDWDYYAGRAGSRGAFPSPADAELQADRVIQQFSLQPVSSLGRSGGQSGWGHRGLYQAGAGGIHR